MDGSAPSSPSGQSQVPSMCVPINILTIVSHVIPPVLGYFVITILVLTPRTHILRISLWPVVALLAMRSAISVDLSFCDPGQQYNNTLFIFLMISIATRALDWTLPKDPFVRYPRPSKARKSSILDTLDLACALRGHGWDWSDGVYFPPETRPRSRKGFVFHVICSTVIHALVCGTFHAAIRAFSPMDIGAAGGSIFDDTLSFHARYLRASLISTCAMLGIYAFIQVCYDVCTLGGVLFLGQDPEQWPPAFDAPWCATSVSQFWGRRWHQFYRRMFLVQGGFPLSFLGRPGFVIGAFLSSGVMHHLAMILLNDQLDPWLIIAGFGMMAPVVLAEHTFKQFTGRKVGGAVGWVWTMAWLLLWGNLIVDGFARCGMFGRFNFTESVVPRRDAIVSVVGSLDAWLHSM